MMVLKGTDKLTDEICEAKCKVENILKSYLDYYATSDWDKIADELTEILARLETVNIQLLYATVRGGD